MSFFSSIVNFFDYFIDFFKTFLSSLSNCLELIREFIIIPPIIQGFMPSFLALAISTCMALSVAKFLVGR